MASPATPRDLKQIVRDGLSTLLFSFGYKTGIIDAFIKIQQPCTAQELSQKSGKKLRYLQEWLSGMIGAGIVKLHEDGKYSLPYEEPILRQWGDVSSVIPIFYEQFSKLENVIEKDGPNGYGYYQPFLKWLDACRSPDMLQAWNQNFLVPVVELKQEKDFTLLDIGCGYGKHTREVAKLYPTCTIYGIDTDQVSIDQAKMELAEGGPQNIQYSCIKASELPPEWTDKFDFVLMNDVLHDAYGVDDILREFKRVLKPDGYGAVFDPPVSSYPEKQANNESAQLFMPFSLFSCLPVSSLGENGNGYGIGWGYERRKQKIEEHGFTLIKISEDINTIQEGIVFQKNVKQGYS
ncbi:demethylmenaquinone methyltransferase-like [Ostrea edulis]|uniref:demethylmenaquinone methyltransferase-like n=1 Tax=Ostrea edulis TaxID=37623 RepID=UPI0024AED720|nr:demethylmenaquinone methyltransferase-like [Ostrea edulis]